MIFENPAALGFLITEDIYCLGVEPALTPMVVAEAPAVPDALPTPAKEPIVIKHLGKNAKTFAIFCHYNEAEYMDEMHLEALVKTLERKALGLDDVAIVNLAKQPESLLFDVIKQLSPKLILILGKAALIKGLPAIPPNKLHVADGRTMLYTYSFNDMMGNRDRTKTFWEQMKIM